MATESEKKALAAWARQLNREAEEVYDNKKATHKTRTRESILSQNAKRHWQRTRAQTKRTKMTSGAEENAAKARKEHAEGTKRSK